MPKVVVTRLIPLPQQAVWNAWSDFGNIHKFHPAVRSSVIIQGPSNALGAVRRCDFYNGTKVEERLTVLEAPLSIGWTLTVPPGPIKRGDALVRLQARGTAQTLVTFTLTYTMKMGPLGWLLGATLVKVAMKKALSQLLNGLDEHLRTGRQVGKGGVPQAA